MKYLLDTNTCVRFLNQRSKAVISRLERESSAEIAVCLIVKAELFFGSMRSGRVEKNLATQHEFLARFKSLPFDDTAAEVYGSIRAKLAAAGTPIGPNDMLIAAIALANNLILVTHNAAEFGRVEGLKIEDWEAT